MKGDQCNSVVRDTFVWIILTLAKNNDGDHVDLQRVWVPYWARKSMGTREINLFLAIPFRISVPHFCLHFPSPFPLRSILGAD